MRSNRFKKIHAVLALLTICVMPSFAVSSAPCTTGATEGATKLYQFLYDNYGKKTISGIMTGDNGSSSTLADQPDYKAVLSMDGDVAPALIGFDFLMTTGEKQNDGWYAGYNANVVSMAKETWKNGGIPAFCWHWRDPSHQCEGYSDTIVSKGYWDFTKAFTVANGTVWNTSSDEYKAMLVDIDKVSDQLLELQKSGVACLWRPLHESAGRWFWWSATCTPQQYIALWKLLYDRMVNVNGVKNCLWVWNIERSKELCQQKNDWSSPATLTADWYPGDAYVDVIGVDVYNRGGNTAASDFYNKIVELMGTNKILALSETDYIPDINDMKTDGAMWSYWMPWDNSWSSMFEKTASSVWTSNMSDDDVIVMKDMAGWGNFIADADPCDNSSSPLRQEAECADYYNGSIVSSSADGYSISGGKAVNCSDDASYINFSFDIPKTGLYKVIIGAVNAYGDKTFAVEVDGSSVNVNQTESGEYVAGTFKLNAGLNTVTVKPGWTWFVIDYARVEADTEAMKPVTPSGSLVTPNSTVAAQKIYSFLVSNWGKKTVSGIMTGSMDNANGKIKDHEDFRAVLTRSGKYPALGGFDFMNATGLSASTSWYKDYTDMCITLAKDLWNEGGIPAFTWHWRDPSYSTDEFYKKDNSHTNGTEIDFTEAMNADGSWNTSSVLYKNMINDIDVVADYFLDLQTAGVAAIFRPLHEASGGWFWWGTQGGENCAKLYRLVYNEIVNVKGVKNLIWVWNPQLATDVDWNPGSTLYDVVSIDIYNSANDNQSNYIAFGKLKDLSNRSKLIALSENGPIPAVDDCYDNDATWSWWMPWYNSWDGNFADQTSRTVWKSTMGDERIITLDEMPGWDNVNVNASTEIVFADSDKVYPTVFTNEINVVCENGKSVSLCNIDGKVILTKKINNDETKIATNKIAKGVYVLNVKYSNGTVKSFKLIKK